MSCILTFFKRNNSYNNNKLNNCSASVLLIIAIRRLLHSYSMHFFMNLTILCVFDILKTKYYILVSVLVKIKFYFILQKIRKIGIP